MANKLYSEEEVDEYIDNFNKTYNEMRWSDGDTYLTLDEITHLLQGGILAIDIAYEYITFLRLDTEED